MTGGHQNSEHADKHCPSLIDVGLDAYWFAGVVDFQWRAGFCAMRQIAAGNA